MADQNFETYRRASILQIVELDPTLARKVKPLFLRGDYEVAVFQAYKEVEVRVREAAGLANDRYGVDLMREAFNPNSGKLTEEEAPYPEREAWAHVFAGAFGVFKNPSSHRRVDWGEPQEAAEIILFANYLLRIVVRRSFSALLADPS